MTTRAHTLLPWTQSIPRLVSDQRIFKVTEVDAVDPRSGKSHVRVVLDCPDWVNVVAVTRDGRMVLIRQHRVGTNSVTLEIPGGMADPDEPIEATAARELEEETGFRAGRWVHLGTSEPNPAFQNNRLHSFLALECDRVNDGHPDEGEDIEVVLMPPDEVLAAVKRGDITHALVLTAFAFEFLRTDERVSFLSPRFGR